MREISLVARKMKSVSTSRAVVEHRTQLLGDPEMVGCSRHLAPCAWSEGRSIMAGHLSEAPIADASRYTATLQRRQTLPMTSASFKSRYGIGGLATTACPNSTNMLLRSKR